MHPTHPDDPRRARAAAIVLALALAGVVAAGSTSAVFDLERFILPKEAVLHAAALALLLLLPARRPATLDALDLFMCLFVAAGLLSAGLAVNSWLAVRGAGLALSGLVVLLAARRVAGAGEAGTVVAALVGAGALAAAIGAADAYGVEWIWHTDTRAPAGSFGNRNAMAHFIALALPLSAVAVLHARSRVVAVLAAGGVALLCLTLVLTRSRAAWLGAGAGGGATLALLLLALPRLPVRRLLLLAGFAGLAAASAVVLPNRLDWRSDAPYAETLAGLANYRGGSGRGRLIQYGHSMDLVQEAPLLGVGPGNWFVHYPRVTEPGDPSFAGHLAIPTNPWPSSDWVAVLAERGALGALLLALAGGSALFLAVRRLRRPAAPWWHAGAGAAAAAGTLVAALVTGLFDAVLLLSAPTLFVAAATGVLLPRRAGRAPPAAGAIRLATAGAVLAMLLLTATWSAAIARTAEGRDRATLAAAARLAPGEHRLRLLLAERGNCAARLPHARAARRLLPHHAAARAAVRSCGT